MRISKQTHTLAVLRAAIGPETRQKEMAGVLGFSIATIQSIEIGRLKLSQKIAEKIAAETNVNLKWLLDDDVSKPIIDGHGIPYTRDTYGDWRQYLQNPKRQIDDPLHAGSITIAGVSSLLSTLANACEHGRFNACVHRMLESMKKLGDEFGPGLPLITGPNADMREMNQAGGFDVQPIFNAYFERMENIRRSKVKLPSKKSPSRPLSKA